MNDSLSVEIHSRLVPVREDEWQRLFPDSPDPLELVRLVEKSGFDGFVFHSLVVRHEDRPILVLPLFETEYRLTEALGGPARHAARIADRWFPNLLRIRVLGVGLVKGEWGGVGVDATVAKDVLRQAWEMALESLDALADGLGAKLLAWVNFTSQSGRMIPMDMMRGYAAISGVPCHMMPIRHDNLDVCLDSLSNATRMERKNPLCHAGSDAEDVNAHLNAESLASETLFKHRSPRVQRVLRSLGRWGACSLKTERPRVKLGRDWQ